MIAIDTRSPGPERLEGGHPAGGRDARSVHVVGDRFFASYLKDAHTQVKVFDTRRARSSARSTCPGSGTASGFGGKRTDQETFYSFTSFTTPATIYRYDVATGKSAVFRKPKVAFDPDRVRDDPGLLPSKDGTKIPMFLSHKKGLKRDGRDADLLYGYGGFNISLTPRSARATWPGWRWAASTPCPICGAAASTARSGTRPARSSRSRTSSTTSSPRPSG